MSGLRRSWHGSMSGKKRLNLSFSMASPTQRQAWRKLMEIPAGRRSAAVCRMICEYRSQKELLDAVRQAVRQELRDRQITVQESTANQAGDVEEDVLGFLLSLQEGDEIT